MGPRVNWRSQCYNQVNHLDRLEEEDIFIIPVVLGGGISWPSTPVAAPFLAGLGGTSGGSLLGEAPASSSSGVSGSGRRGVTLPSAYSNSWGRGVFLLTYEQREAFTFESTRGFCARLTKFYANKEHKNTCNS